MSAHRAVEEFDEISQVYDETREPLAPYVVDALATTLIRWGVHDLLEVGVGTGRVAGPLAARGPEVTGLDASRGMLARARSKGIPRLIRGSAYRLPFDARTFDVALFVHVLHVLDDPAEALREACRVSRIGAAALVRPVPAGEENGREREPGARQLVMERLRGYGVPLPPRAHGGPMGVERSLLTQFPPERLVTVSEEDVTEPLSAQLAMFERRASRWTARVPPETMARAVAETRESLGDRVHTYHRVRALALWERPPSGVLPQDGPRPVMAG